jgi:hypothetical protein
MPRPQKSRLVWLFRYFVTHLGKHMPTGRPEWCAILSGLIIAVAWTVVPEAFYHIYRDIPLLSPVVRTHLPNPHAPAWVGYGVAVLLSMVSVAFFCRLLMLCYPKYYDIEALRH